MMSSSAVDGEGMGLASTRVQVPEARLVSRSAPLSCKSSTTDSINNGEQHHRHCAAFRTSGSIASGNNMESRISIPAVTLGIQGLLNSSGGIYGLVRPAALVAQMADAFGGDISAPVVNGMR